jgi:hypothetical protein
MALLDGSGFNSCQVHFFIVIIIVILIIINIRTGYEWPRTFLVHSLGISLLFLLESRNVRNRPEMD